MAIWEDQHQFILGRRVLREENDIDAGHPCSRLPKAHDGKVLAFACKHQQHVLYAFCAMVDRALSPQPRSRISILLTPIS